MATSTSGETRSARKRNSILASARALFAREGFAYAGMEQVARDAGVSTATLYAHFPGKADLFTVVVKDALAEIANHVRRSAKAEGDARTRLAAFSRAYADFYCTAPARATFRMVVSERRRFPHLADEVRAHARTQLAGTLVDILQSLEADGAIRVESPAWAAGQLQGMIEHPTLLLGLLGGDDAMPARPLDSIVDEAVETFLARYGVRETGAGSSSPFPRD